MSSLVVLEAVVDGWGKVIEHVRGEQEKHTARMNVFDPTITQLVKRVEMLEFLVQQLLKDRGAV